MNRFIKLAFASVLVVASTSANALTFVADLDGGNGTVFDFSNPDGAFDLSFVMVGSDESGAGGGAGGDAPPALVEAGGSVLTTYTAMAPAALVVSGEYSYLSSDIDGPALDPFGYVINGALFQLSDDDGADSQAGTFYFEVAMGDIFGWYIDATDDTLGAASVSVGAQLVPVPAALPLLGSALLGFVLVRRPTT